MIWKVCASTWLSVNSSLFRACSIQPSKTNQHTSCEQPRKSSFLASLQHPPCSSSGRFSEFALSRVDGVEQDGNKGQVTRRLGENKVHARWSVARGINLSSAVAVVWCGDLNPVARKSRSHCTAVAAPFPLLNYDDLDTVLGSELAAHTRVEIWCSRAQVIMLV